MADNKTGELAGWDFEKLALELEQIESLDMGEFGFESHDLGGEIGDFFENAPTSNSNEHKPKTVTCPHCGEEFEI